MTVLIILVLFFSCCYLGIKVKKLEEKINEFQNYNNSNYEKNIIKSDIVSMDDISSNDIEVHEKKLDREEKKVDNNKGKVNIDRDNNKIDNSSSNIINNKFNVNDFVRKDNIYRKLDSSNMNIDYLQEVSRELANNAEPQPIKLTDYEQEQEDNAIISYKELVDVNRKENAVNDGTLEFIEELKNFRNNLR